MAHGRWQFPLLTFVALICLACQLALAVPGDENWDTRFGAPGVTGNLAASTVFDGDLVIGGAFTAVGDLAVGNVARWDGTQWNAMGDGFDADVSALVVWNNELYAGGEITGGLARWDGAQWVDVGGGVGGSVSSLSVWNADLAVGGFFSSVGGGAVTAGGVAIWNGTSWNGMNDGTNGDVADVASYGGSLYVCGEFDIVDGVVAGNLARWNGSAWSSVGGGLSDDSGDIDNAYGSALAVSGGSLIVGGYFARAGSVVTDGVVAWNGSSFSALGEPSFGGEALALGTLGSDVVAGDAWGNINLWNGIFWNTIGITGGGAYTFVEREGDLIAGGEFSTIGGAWMPGLARYDGTWSPIASGQGASGTVECFHDWNGTEVVGGGFARVGNVTGVIASWDGAAWQPMGSGIPRGNINFVGAMATFEDDLVVGGSFATAGGVTVSNIARWDGSQWSAMGTGSQLSSVSGVVALGGVLYANGRWNGQYTLGRWNGSDFDPLGTSVVGGVQILYSLGSYQGDPVMGGSFTTVDGVVVNNIARWDGNAWQPLGSGTNGAVYAIHEVGGLLYVGGTFSQAGGLPASHVAMWDGTDWHAVGGGIITTVDDIASIGADVYATGQFAQAEGQPVSRIARWDGIAWQALGSGLDNRGHALDAQDGQLWVGGEFVQAGLTGSSHIAVWHPGSSSTATPEPAGVTRTAMRPAWPNPFAGSTVLAFDLPAPANVTIDVFDVRGARVRRFDRSGLDAGSHRVIWDGRDAAGHPAPAGVYFMALRDGRSSARQRVVLVK